MLKYSKKSGNPTILAFKKAGKIISKEDMALKSAMAKVKSRINKKR